MSKPRTSIANSLLDRDLLQVYKFVFGFQYGVAHVKGLRALAAYNGGLMTALQQQQKQNEHIRESCKRQRELPKGQRDAMRLQQDGRQPQIDCAKPSNTKGTKPPLLNSC